MFNQGPIEAFVPFPPEAIGAAGIEVVDAEAIGRQRVFPYDVRREGVEGMAAWLTRERPLPDPSRPILRSVPFTAGL